MLIIAYLLEGIEESDHVGAEAGKRIVGGFPLIPPAQPGGVWVVCSPGRISREGGMPPTRLLPLSEIFPVLRGFKESHQIPLNLLINKESTADFFLLFLHQIAAAGGKPKPPTKWKFYNGVTKSLLATWQE